MYVNTAEQISGIPASWPGYDLTIGSSGSKVRQLQEQLDAIATVYTAIPDITVDGIYGPATARAVREFQSILVCPRPALWILPPGTGFVYLCGGHRNCGN